MRSNQQHLPCGIGRSVVAVRWLAAFCVLAGPTTWSAHASPAQTVSIRMLPNEPHQVIDGFGTCLYGREADSEWFQTLFLDDLRCSILRIDLTPHFGPPFSDDSYNSPRGDGTDGSAGPEGNNVRTYSGPSDYGRRFGGRDARIAVMGPDIEQNLRVFDFGYPDWKTAGRLAKLGAARKNELGDFKLVGSVWSPAPWLKLASGNRISEQMGPQYPKVGTPWPFIWAGNFSGGRFDASGIPRPQFDDSGLGGHGPTSARLQFARGLAAEVRGFQRAYQVQFYAISLQNELNFETYYSSCAYPRASDYVAVLKEVRQEFDRYEDLKSILIMGPEDLLGDPYGLWQLGGKANPTHRNLQYLTAVAADKEATGALAFFAIHGYAADGVSSAGASPDHWLRWADGWQESPVAGLPDNVAGFRSYEKKSWMTETSGEVPSWLAPASGFPGEGALGLAVRIHQALTAGQQSAWLYWQLSDGRNGAGLETLTDARLRGESPKYVAAKHFFAPIRPGSRRVETHVGGAPTILASAYIHPATGTVVLVVINLDSASQPVVVEAPPLPSGIRTFRVWTSASQIQWQASVATIESGRANLILPGYGIVTLVGVGEVEASGALGLLPGARPQGERTVDHQGRTRGPCLRVASRHRGYLGVGILVLAVAYLLRRWRR
jgi:O-glycosyl hydrolase